MPGDNTSRVFECFSCGSLYRVADSRAANTPEIFEKTYCSKLCCDIDSEQIEKEIKLEQEQQAANLALQQDEVKLNTTEMRVGGFTLNVRKP